MRRITGGRDGMEWGIIGGFGVGWASNYSWTPTSQYQHCQENIVSNVCIPVLTANLSQERGPHLARALFLLPSAHALSLLSLFYALGADKEPLCASVCASRSSLSTSSTRPSCALSLLVPAVTVFCISSALHVPLLTCLPSSNRCQRPHSNVFIWTKWKKGL